jgi:hypothetical protein
MSGSRTRLEAAAEAGCCQGPESCGNTKGEIDQIEPEQIVSTRRLGGCVCQVSQLLLNYNLTPHRVSVHQTDKFVRT